MQLAELVQGIPLVAPPPAAEITGVSHDSRRVEPGDLFVAIRGENFDGRRFSGEAARQGAAAVLGQGEAPPDLEIPWLSAAVDPRSLLGSLASRVYGAPDRELSTIGITGTNGKSTVVALVSAILEAAGRPCGRVGTLGYEFRDLRFEGIRTTPEASDLFRILRRMHQAGAEAAAMEISSHALTLGRIDGLTLNVALFTNLTRDHLDHHPNMESYFAAKRRIFEHLEDGGVAVVNVDDPYGRRLADELPSALTFSGGAPEGNPEGSARQESAKDGNTAAAPRVHASEVALDDRGIRGRLETPRGGLPFRSRLLGRYNVWNLCAAAAVAEALELPHEAVRKAFAEVRPVPGRLERVRPSAPVKTFVDYAHTPAALEAALRSVRELTDEKVFVVFGCGGDRDPGKRAVMGRIAGELADFAVATSDNPRGEDPMAILSEIERGLRESGSSAYRIVPDRREAIHRTVAVAPKGSVVLVAGKGHEETQLIGDRILPFSDRREIGKALEKRLGRKTSG